MAEDTNSEATDQICISQHSTDVSAREEHGTRSKSKKHWNNKDKHDHAGERATHPTMSQSSQPSMMDVMTMFTMMMQTQEKARSDEEIRRREWEAARERERAEERKQAEVARRTHEFTIVDQARKQEQMMIDLQAKQYNLAVTEAAAAKESWKEQQEQQKIRENKKLAEAAILAYPKIKSRVKLDTQTAGLEELLTSNNIGKE